MVLHRQLVFGSDAGRGGVGVDGHSGLPVARGHENPVSRALFSPRMRFAVGSEILSWGQT